ASGTRSTGTTWIIDLWSPWPPHWPFHLVPTAKSPDFLRRRRLHPPGLTPRTLVSGLEFRLRTDPHGHRQSWIGWAAQVVAVEEEHAGRKGVELEVEFQARNRDL